MSDEIDDLLRDLEESVITKDVAEPEPPPVYITPPIVPDLSEPPPPPREPSDLEVVVAAPVDPVKSMTDLIDLNKFVEEFDRNCAAIDTDILRDRALLDRTVKLLYERVEGGTASNIETESLVRALQTKVDSHGHRAKLLDSKTKLLASMKSTVQTIIQNNMNGGNDNEELVRILSENKNVINEA